MARTETVTFTGIEKIPHITPESLRLLRSLDEVLGGRLDVQCLHAKEGGCCVVSTNLHIQVNGLPSDVRESAFFPEHAVLKIIARLHSLCIDKAAPLVLTDASGQEHKFSITKNNGSFAAQPVLPNSGPARNVSSSKPWRPKI